MTVSASADYPHPRASEWSDPRTVRIRKCTAIMSPRIDCVHNCTVITGIQSPARNTHANEQSQSAEFYVTYKVKNHGQQDALLRLHYTVLRPVWCSSKCGYCGFDPRTVRVRKRFQSSGLCIIRKICGSRSVVRTPVTCTQFYSILDNSWDVALWPAVPHGYYFLIKFSKFSSVMAFAVRQSVFVSWCLSAVHCTYVLFATVGVR